MTLLSLIFKGRNSKELSENDFRKVFELYFDDLRRFLYYKSRDLELAEDMAQDAFVKLWEKRDDVKLETVKTLLFTIGNNLMINTFKKDQRHITFVNQEDDRHEMENPEYILEEKEFKAELESIINSLPDGSRVVFLMNRIDGKKYADIAKDLGIVIKAVEKRMSIALKILREKLPGKI
jgi:RNA polymerase sigma-70 factor (family 1)